METVATQQIIDAAATLDAADRALLNIWVNQGLDDERLAGLTGIDSETLAWRKRRLVRRLADEIGDPAPDVHVALEKIAATGREANIKQQRGRGRRRGVIAASAGLVIAAVVVVILATSWAGGSKRGVASHRTATAAARDIASTKPTPATAPSVATTPAAPSGVPGARSSRRLADLPGIRTNLDGWVGLVGTKADIKLELSLRVPPAPGGDRYEVWLYNSILDSRAVGVLRTGTDITRYRLASDAARYRWIDISLQPPGAIAHSGESRLRAANPIYARSGH